MVRECSSMEKNQDRGDQTASFPVLLSSRKREKMMPVIKCNCHWLQRQDTLFINKWKIVIVGKMLWYENNSGHDVIEKIIHFVATKGGNSTSALHRGTSY